MAGGQSGRARTGDRTHRFRQDAGRVPVGARPAGHGRSTRAEAALPGVVRLPAQGARRGRPAQPPRAVGRYLAGLAQVGAGASGHHRGHADGRHHTRRTPRVRAHPARHPGDHTGVAVPAADVSGAGVPARRRDRDRRRGARRRGQQARRTPGGVAGTPRRPARPPRAAHRTLGDGTTRGRGGCVPHRWQARPRRATHAEQDDRGPGRGARRGHG